MRTRPDHRYRTVLAAMNASQPVPSDPKSAALFALLTKAPGSVASDVVQAHDLHTEVEHRCVVDAFLLTRSPHHEIASVLEMDYSVVETYAHLYMDMSVFRNRLEVVSYAARYDGDAYGKELVRTAVSVGADYMHWAYGKPRDTFDPRRVIQHTMTDSFYRGMAHKGNALTTSVAKEAHKWWATAVKNAELSERLNPSTAKQAIEELRIALGKQDETHTPDAFDVPVTDILH